MMKCDIRENQKKKKNQEKKNVEDERNVLHVVVRLLVNYKINRYQLKKCRELSYVLSCIYTLHSPYHSYLRFVGRQRTREGERMRCKMCTYVGDDDQA